MLQTWYRENKGDKKMTVEHTPNMKYFMYWKATIEKRICQILATSFKLIVKRVWWSDLLKSTFTKKAFSSLGIEKVVRVKSLFWCMQHRFQQRSCQNVKTEAKNIEVMQL